MAYLTPTETPTTVTCRGLLIPDGEEYLAIVRGALQELTFAHNWVKFGTLTPQEAADAFFPMFDDFCLKREVCRMIGEIIAYAGTSSPRDTWLVCDGSEVSQDLLPDLYAVIGDTYGSASSGNFRLPDLRGRSLAGSGSASPIPPVAVGDMYGDADHTLTVFEMPSHIHDAEPHSHTVNEAFPALLTIGAGAPTASAVPSPSVTGASTVTIDATGGDTPFSILPPRLGILYLIVAQEG